jgi:acyl-CoA reductase-like NAD-dependent aldehyde dehydrogenase
MKLFVWHGVLEDYTGGVAFAMADDVDQARQAAAEAFSKCREYSDPEKARARMLHELRGEPNEVHEGPSGGYCWGGA